MVTDDTVGNNVHGLLLTNEAQWLDRVPPELEWDENEAALLVDEIVGASRVRGQI